MSLVYVAIIAFLATGYIYIRHLKNQVLKAQNAQFNKEIESITAKIKEESGDLTRWKEIRDAKLRDLNKPSSTDKQE
jgi:hypothetical protein